MTKQKQKQQERPCIYETIHYDSVPYGSTNVSMPTSDCTYEGDIDISGSDVCGPICPAYKPELIDNRPYHTLKGNGLTYCGIPNKNVKYDYYPTCKKCFKAMGLKEE